MTVRRLALVAVAASLVALVAHANDEPPARARDRVYTVEGKKVRLPAAWLTCSADGDCQWVEASCADVRTGVNVAHAKDTRARLDRACKGSFNRVRRIDPDGPPGCDKGVCSEHEEPGPRSAD